MGPAALGPAAPQQEPARRGGYAQVRFASLSVWRHHRLDAVRCYDGYVYDGYDYADVEVSTAQGGVERLSRDAERGARSARAQKNEQRTRAAPPAGSACGESSSAHSTASSDVKLDLSSDSQSLESRGRLGSALASSDGRAARVLCSGSVDMMTGGLGQGRRLLRLAFEMACALVRASGARLVRGDL